MKCNHTANILPFPRDPTENIAWAREWVLEKLFLVTYIYFINKN